MSRKVQPKDSRWTDEQWAAIVQEGSDILVSAAAGSGKTAVLVERIIRKISDLHEPVDVDRLLVATFTNAAAAEMKQRIRQALEKALEQTTGESAVYLRRQLALIPRASVTTLHSFCLELIQRHAQVLQLDPAFRVAQVTEIELIRQDVLEDLFEAYYAEEHDDSPFWELAEAYGGGRGDEELYELVEKLYDFSRSHPWPEHWLHQQVQRFLITSSSGNQSLSSWLESLQQHVTLLLSGAKVKLAEAIHLCKQPGGPAAYVETLIDDQDQLETLLHIARTADWNLLTEQFQSYTFSRLKAARGDDLDSELQERIKQLRNEVKKMIEDLKVELFSRTLQQYEEELKTLAPLMQMLVSLVNDFAMRFEQVKRSKSVVDFNDLEHYTLQVLLAPNTSPTELIPSAYALEYRAQYEEILLDEYQDTNRVQEAIVQLLARTEPGNRFMVGDVKQSIYRFRLAEPALFLDKYHTYESNGDATGQRIDLARNFRSRQQVLDGVNFVFRQIMQEPVGEMTYDQRAELVCGATYPPVAELATTIDVWLIDREPSAENADFDSDELETAQLEARMIARQIASMMGLDGTPPLQVLDPETGEERRVTYRDFVVLLRATKAWAPLMMEELQAFGLPCYAEVDHGYFASGEIEMMLALLKIVDNPYQDIPLAAVLRSPIVQLTAEQLALVRLADEHGAFYDAVRTYAELEVGGQPLLQNRLRTFLARLEQWRWEASQGGSLSELIWGIYRETGLVEIVAGLPGGSQRQANLRALYDRARQYEATSFRGLFRFLRFIERLRERGGDLGAARALSEQEDVVRIMSIHKSKGLEFPIVFVAGIGKQFNRMDLHRPFLLHKDFGFGPKVVDVEQRMTYPSLPHLAIRRRLDMELLAEEMRVLYVAMTRAKEKLVFIGTARKLDQQFIDWGAVLASAEWSLPDHMLVGARSYLDWLGPALMRHRDTAVLRELAQQGEPKGDLLFDSSRWNVQLVSAQQEELFAEVAVSKEQVAKDTFMAIQQTKPIPTYEPSKLTKQVQSKLEWTYPFKAATGLFTKTSVSELKRMEESAWIEEEATALLPHDSLTVQKQLLKRPRFMEKTKMTPAERGTAYHTVMQHLDMRTVYTTQILEEQLNKLVLLERISEEQCREIDPQTLLAFFESSLGERVRHATNIYRELPFSYALPANEVYEGTGDVSDETVLIQGVIDCLFQEDQNWILLDYKTDTMFGHTLADIHDRYELQIRLYTRAISDIWKRPVKEKYLFLFDGSHVLEM